MGVKVGGEETRESERRMDPRVGGPELRGKDVPRRRPKLFPDHTTMCER